MEMLKETAKPDSQPENVLSQWEAEENQELSQGEDVQYEELSPWGFEKYQEALQWGEQRVYELFQWELERYQELSPGEDVKVQDPSQWEGKRAEEMSQAAEDSDQGLWQWEGSMEQELSEGEVRVRGEPELSQKGDNTEQELWQENGEHITIRTIWVNPKYPELLQKPQPVSQRSARAAASPAWWEEEAGAESPGPAPHSPCCPHSPSPPCPEGAVAGAELPGPQIEPWSFAKEEQVCKYIRIHTIWVNPKYPELLQKLQPTPQEWALAASSPGCGEQVPEAGAESQVPRKRPSRCRRLLRALRRLFCIPCLAGRPED